MRDEARAAKVAAWIHTWSGKHGATFTEVPPGKDVRLMCHLHFEVEIANDAGYTEPGIVTLPMVAMIATTGDETAHLVLDTIWPASEFAEMPEVYYGTVEMEPMDDVEEEADDGEHYRLLQLANHCNEELPAKTVVVDQEGGYYLQVRNSLPLDLCTQKATNSLLAQHESCVCAVMSLHQQLLCESPE